MSKVGFHRTGKYYTDEDKLRRRKAAKRGVSSARLTDMQERDILWAIEESLRNGEPDKWFLEYLFKAGQVLVKCRKKPWGYFKVLMEPDDYISEFVVGECYMYEDFSVGAPPTVEEVDALTAMYWQRCIKKVVAREIMVKTGYSQRAIHVNKERPEFEKIDLAVMLHNYFEMAEKGYGPQSSDALDDVLALLEVLERWEQEQGCSDG